MGRQVSSRGGVPHLSGVSLCLLSNCVGPFCLDTHDEFPVLISRSQSEPLFGFRVSTDLPALIFSSDSDGRGFRNSRTALLSESLPLTKIWGRDALQGGGAEDCPRRRRTSKKGGFPPGHPPPRQTPHTPQLRGACSAFVRFLFFLFRVLFQNRLILRSWRPGSAAACGGLGASLSGTPDPKPWVIIGARVGSESGGIRPQGLRHQVSVY